MALKAANDKSMSNITALPSGVSAKSLILISTTTASSSATVDITSGIDDTYKEYIIKFYDVHPATDNANDSGISGYLHLYDPSNTTFVKHFIAQTSSCLDGGASYGIYNLNFFTAGYGNTTSAVDAVQFKMSSGNIDAGVIKMYGVS